MNADWLSMDAALLLLTRWVHFAALALLFGVPFYWLHAPGGFPRARRQSWRLLRLAAPVAAVTGVLWCLALFANMAGGYGAIFDPETLSLFLLHTPFGPVTVLRLGLLAALVAASGPTPRFGFMLGASALALADQAWLGHAAEGGFGAWGALMIGVYILHVGAASAWIGGLPPLLLVLREARTDPRRCVEALQRFSVAGLVLVAMIGASGLGNVAFRVGWSFQILAQADYGWVLAVKSALVAAMLALAAYNRLVALPGLRAKADVRILARLVHGIACECALGLGVLAAAALLGVTPPPQ